MKIISKLLGLSSKLFGSVTAILFIVCVVMYFVIGRKNKVITVQKKAMAEYISDIESLRFKLKEDSLNQVNQVREVQSVLGQVHNENKSLKKENANLRKGVRLDLLRVRVRRNGRAIDSTFTEGYKYLSK